jgi:alpha-1,3-rhamnosyltransferase
MIPIAEDKPRVSVLIPAYNHEKFVEDAILSVVNQSYGFENIELIVTDDCSSDNTVEKLQRLQQQYGFRLILHHKNIGVSSTLNEMILLASSIYITSFASDDVMVPDRIQNQIRFYKNILILIFLQVPAS